MVNRFDVMQDRTLTKTLNIELDNGVAAFATSRCAELFYDEQNDEVRACVALASEPFATRNCP